MKSRSSTTIGYKVSKLGTHANANLNAGGGTTQKIREQLNFTDERKWKQFSGRRLELIDKFGLSERKASEQDDNIRQIATILRTEFGYPLNTASDFEKLVTAAVQSVRRNRKRSKKRSPTTPSGKACSPSSGIPSPISSSNNTAMNSGSYYCNTSDEDFIVRTESPNLDRSSISSTSSAKANANNNNPLVISLPSIQPKTIFTAADGSAPPRTTALSSHLSVPVIHSQQRYNDIIKSIISDLVNNTVPLVEQSEKDQYNGPNLTDFALSTNDQQLLSVGLNSKDTRISKNQNNNFVAASSPLQNTDIPFFLREKILLQIQRSRTCFDIAVAQGSIDLYSNLEILGEMSIRSSIAFVIERFFSNLMPSSMEYIISKTYSQESLSLLSSKLFSPATKRNLMNLPQKTVQMKLLYLVIGGLVKDFGFDPCLYPLSEAVHHLVMKQYPLLYKSANGGGSMPPDNNTNQRTAVLSSLSMKPQMANQDVNKKVVIRFKDREQHFTFHLLSNGPPTISEIIENCKSLFRIVSQTKSLGLYHKEALVHDDVDLAKLFNNFSNENISLEVKEMESTTSEMNGLKILSAASVKVKKEITSTSASSSVTALDNIINRISKFPTATNNNTASPTETQFNHKPCLQSVAGKNITASKNYFQNGNLPQPVFQPLL